MKKLFLLSVVFALMSAFLFTTGWGWAQSKDKTIPIQSLKNVQTILNESVQSMQPIHQLVQRSRDLRNQKDQFMNLFNHSMEDFKNVQKFKNEIRNLIDKNDRRYYLSKIKTMQENGADHAEICQFILGDLREKNNQKLRKSQTVQEDSSTIKGSVTSQIDGTPIPFVFIFAFNMEDTTVAAIGIQTLFSYEITVWESGDYVFMATDILGGLKFEDFAIRDFGFNREFYAESKTPDDATVVTVGANETKTGINFTLDLGGAISGKLTNEEGESLVNVLVIALRGDLQNMNKFFTNVDIGIGTTDSLGRYQITGLSDGQYYVRTLSITSQYDSLYLDEWYSPEGNVYYILDFGLSTQVQVTELDTTSDIDFQLERGGTIAGKVMDANDSSPVYDVEMILAFDAERELPAPQLAPFEYVEGMEDGSYLLSLLPPGTYKLLAFVDPENEAMYLSQFYDGKASYDQADPVSVSLGDTTKDIDFYLIQGGLIQGEITMADQRPADSDTLMEYPIILYNASTGGFAGGAMVDSVGEYQIKTIPPGQYKLAALPIVPPHAITYYGGGGTYDDQSNTIITIAPGDIKDANIQLGQAQGVITGSVIDAETETPLDSVFFLSYDGTGHVTSGAMSGAVSTPYSTPGSYAFGNLRSSDYYIRTFSLFSALMSIEDIMPEDDGIPDISSLLGEIELYADEWYDDVPVNLPELNKDMFFRYLFNLKYEELGILPFFQMIPMGEAQTVNVVSGGSPTTNIDFALGKFSFEELIPVSVDDSPSNPMPKSFQLGQSYPNPVSQSKLQNGVMISFRLPKANKISISIFNILGQKVTTLVNREIHAGVHTVRWNGKDNVGNRVPSGIYFYSLDTESGIRHMKKLIVLK